MDWNDIRLILEISRSGSFAAAAECLGVKPTTVSRRISALEVDTRVRLFHRTPHGAAPTPAGQILVRHALKVEEAAADYENLLRRGGEPTRLIKVQMSEGMASYLFAPAMAQQPLGPLGTAASRLRIKLPPIQILSPLQPETPDIALIWTQPGQLPDGHPTDRIKKLCDIGFIPYFSDAYQGRRDHAPGRLADLRRHKLVTMKAYDWFHTAEWEEWHSVLGGARSAPIVADWSSTLGHLTQAGRGIGLLPSYSHMYSNLIKPLEIIQPPLKGSVWLKVGELEYSNRAVRRCFDLISRLFSEADWDPR